MAGADVTNLAEVALGRHVDAGLALDRLDEEGSGVGRDSGLQGGGVAEGDGLEARGEGAEAVTVELLGREGDHGGGAAVEVVLTDDDLGVQVGDALDAVAPEACRLDRGLDRLRAGVHRQHHVVSGEVAQVLGHQGELVVAEGARGEGEPFGLLNERPHDAWVAVALVDRRVGAQAVQVTFALHIPDPDPLSPFDDHINRVIGVRAVGVLQSDVVLSLHGYRLLPV